MRHFLKTYFPWANRERAGFTPQYYFSSTRSVFLQLTISAFSEAFPIENFLTFPWVQDTCPIFTMSCLMGVNVSDCKLVYFRNIPQQCSISLQYLFLVNVLKMHIYLTINHDVTMCFHLVPVPFRRHWQWAYNYSSDLKGKGL